MCKISPQYWLRIAIPDGAGAKRYNIELWAGGQHGRRCCLLALTSPRVQCGRARKAYFEASAFERASRPHGPWWEPRLPLVTEGRPPRRTPWRPAEWEPPRSAGPLLPGGQAPALPRHGSPAAAAYAPAPALREICTHVYSRAYPGYCLLTIPAVVGRIGPVSL